VLVCNPDIVLHASALERVLGLAETDHANVAAWELRQQPYEHPKHYDPVTWETAWTSHACVLLRREALTKVGGFDTRIFMYGEDVELSYRFRSAGYRLRYCPHAVAFHNTYTVANEVKPEQYIGSQVASVYLRLRYGSAQDLASVPWFIAAMLIRPSPFWGAKGRLLKRLLSQVGRYSRGLLKERRNNQEQGIFPFRGFDYELRRQGAFVNQPALEESLAWPDLPLVSILTRTVQGRESLLVQAGYSVLQQSYPNIEWVVVEDGGDAQREVVDFLANQSNRDIRYSSLAQVGRSAAGNEALALARGQYCLFLDDDDLLYADHVETLMKPLLQNPQAAAAYGLCWSIESAFSPKGELVAEVHYGQISAHETPFDAQRLEFENFLPIQAVLFARRLFLERGGFNTELDALEDWNLWRRYSTNETFLYVPKTTSLYRVPHDSAKKNARQKTLDDAYQKVRRLSEEDVKKLLTTNPEGRKNEALADLGDYVEKTEPVGHG
jgi:GT2 family glycosyltransferase